MTQAQVDKLLNNFIKVKAGERLSYNGYKGECLSLAKQWVDTLAGRKVAPPSGNNKGSGYYTNFPSPLGTYFTKQAWKPGKAYPRGSLVVYTKTSHIGIFLSAGKTDASLFEQNADPDGSPAATHQRPNKKIDGILVLKVTQPVATNLETVRPTSWNVRTKPDVHGTILGVVTQGQKYLTVEQSNGWRKITFKGKTGYVAGSAWK